ncbi:hypothetical protein OH76DRAFT_1182351 [Lentinus brumalis]|uniref:Uncharacterized protein n=1 Tax=Lentinus brumalis TaxID=2498619 RepID=A0A371CTW7_9APHY|nr:hypothetical protein OH76DRAFT_1182351 [Polyporus brumalis]
MWERGNCVETDGVRCSMDRCARRRRSQKIPSSILYPSGARGYLLPPNSLLAQPLRLSPPTQHTLALPWEPLASDRRNPPATEVFASAGSILTFRVVGTTSKALAPVNTTWRFSPDTTQTVRKQMCFLGVRMNRRTNTRASFVSRSPPSFGHEGVYMSGPSR